jgi:hypothetical protein
MIYNALKIVIKGGNYDRQDLLNKMDFFLLKGRITQEQYEVLETLID